MLIYTPVINQNANSYTPIMTQMLNHIPRYDLNC